MSKENGTIISEELLFRHFDDEASKDEAAFIDVWMDESEENRLEYDRIHIFYLDVKAIGSLKKKGHQYNATAAWENINSKNHIKQPKGETRITVSNQLLKIAAMIVVVLGAGWFAYDSFYSTKISTIAAIQQSVEQPLADGSIITLNQNSKLTYPEKFIEDERRVELEGEAYFDIAANPEKPFIIKASEVEIQVVGTSFNVNANESIDSIVVSVDTGIVRIVTAIREETLEAGSIGVYYRSTQVLTKIESNNVGVQNFWRTKHLSFNGTSLLEVIGTINMTYDVEISLSDPLLGNCKLSVDFENESLEDILDVIATTLRLELSKENDIYLLSGEGCN